MCPDWAKKGLLWKFLYQKFLEKPTYFIFIVINRQYNHWINHETFKIQELFLTFLEDGWGFFGVRLFLLRTVAKTGLGPASTKRLARHGWTVSCCPISPKFCRLCLLWVTLLRTFAPGKTELQRFQLSGRGSTFEPAMAQNHGTLSTALNDWWRPGRANHLLVAGPKPVFATVLGKKRRTPKNPQPPSKQC